MKKSNEFNQLHPEGLSRWRQIKPIVNVCWETWRLKGLAGKAPQPIRHGLRCTFYRNSDVLEWLADPVNYVAPEAKTPKTLRQGG